MCERLEIAYLTFITKGVSCDWAGVVFKTKSRSVVKQEEWGRAVVGRWPKAQ